MNEENPSYVEFITGEGGVIDTWLRRGAAGFRLDVADELPDDFIEKIRAAVKRVSPEKFLLGEVWRMPPPNTALASAAPICWARGWTA